MQPSGTEKKASPSKWIPDIYQSNYWKTKEGRKICLQDDVCLCVTTLEDNIMRRNAIVKLSKYGVHIHYTKGQSPTRHPIAMFFQVEHKNVFGVSIEKAYQIEKHLHDYPKVRINSQYASHIPHFFLATVKSVAEHGMSGVSILNDEGCTFQTSMMQQQLREGAKLVYDSKEYCAELSMLMRIFLRDLSEGLLTNELEVGFGYIARIRHLSVQVEALQFLVQVLPRANREALFLVLSLCRKLLFFDRCQHKVRKMMGIFTRLIFRTEYRINGIGNFVLKVMIRNMDNIFTLSAATLNVMYKQIAMFHPKKLDAVLELRASQNQWDGSDIPNVLQILIYQGRSFELIPLDEYVLAKERAKDRHKQKGGNF